MKKRITHGETLGRNKTPEYIAWSGSRNRCNNKNDKAYSRYGGRGIKHKIDSVTDLIKAIGRKPTSQHSLDRIDNDGHYEVGNIRWATKGEQQKNKRTNVKYKGEYAVDASKRLGGGVSLISYRLSISWSLKKAFTTPKR